VVREEDNRIHRDAPKRAHERSETAMTEQSDTRPEASDRSEAEQDAEQDLELKDDDAANVAGGRKAGENPLDY
jgi:hypothetical protein